MLWYLNYFFTFSIFLSNVIGFYGNINNLFFNYYISNMQIKYKYKYQYQYAHEYSMRIKFLFFLFLINILYYVTL
jgi:hypothetical protein